VTVLGPESSRVAWVGPRALSRIALAVSILALALGTTGSAPTTTPVARPDVRPRPLPISREQRAFIDTLEARTFRWFWDLTDPRTGLTPDRAPTPSFVSIAAVGFALTAYPIGAERGYVTRAQARDRTLATLRFLWASRQDTAAAGVTGWRGFYYHFLDSRTGHRFEQVELSTVDTALLLAGVLFCQSYFDRRGEDSIRVYAESLYARVDWRWSQARPPALSHGWTPEQGFLEYDWKGYNEAMLVYVLALGSTTHPIERDSWGAWTSTYRWGSFHGYQHVGFPPLFGHQYSHVWIDFRGIQDDTMRARKLDYFENSRRATLAQQAYAVTNPGGFTDYGARIWGLTACDGPVEGRFEIDGRSREFHTYWARGASFNGVHDDGTISPSAAGGSIAFAPEAVIPSLLEMRRRYGERVFNQYGFVDAFNPTLRKAIPVQHGTVDTTLGWFDVDQLGIDQGPILAMIENWRSGLVWRVMARNPHVVRGLERAGFRGGWLDRRRAAGRK
jgi:hypothetical protein